MHSIQQIFNNYFHVVTQFVHENKDYIYSFFFFFFLLFLILNCCCCCCTCFGGDIFLVLISFLFPPLPVWFRRGICSADAFINLALCCLGYFPGLIHSWYIISHYPQERIMDEEIYHDTNNIVFTVGHTHRPLYQQVGPTHFQDPFDSRGVNTRDGPNNTLHHNHSNFTQNQHPSYGSTSNSNTYSDNRHTDSSRSEVNPSDAPPPYQY